MTFLTRPRQSLALALLLLVIVGVSACGTGGNTSSPGAQSSNKGTITIAGKQNIESSLLADMYTLLLKKAGYTVNEKLALGDTPLLFQAIKTGAIDIYPEFTGTALGILNVSSSYDPQKDYQTVKQGYESKYKITWLDASPLNDGYALCTLRSEAEKLKIKTLSDLAPQVSQLALAVSTDGIPYIDSLKSTYNFSTASFKSLQKVEYNIGVAAVQHNLAQLNMCYTTDGTIESKGFIFLSDDKHGFPEFHPAPLVRDGILQKYPDIAQLLNPLAPKLTTEISIELQKQVQAKKDEGTSLNQATRLVATQFLKSQGML
ncbi:glycine/betaine ABC transporter substrate-binding protein [Ktedonosporobacter rubrisoli]|uniref:Glycine/betaine ABC transporter substrate-binding protein n=1 Tax=Ktedonosporobacter rubrisoli TaxID=2509675 RepID=A0A4P6JI55_KTERU|nr:glycine betaine ABC transporter substrate-binding protein [Ktedonosporobacter rubrisoli]QBD74735.1 glycine/betaine ABC transporter substrate-binding protein [Ktedonosporobacter rubrisoli]